MDQKKQKLRKLWRQRIQDYQSSGLSGAKWCKKHGIPQHQLSYWKSKYAAKSPISSEKSPESNWIPVTVEAADAASPSTALTIRVGSVEIEVKTNYNAKLLQDVVRTLRELC